MPLSLGERSVDQQLTFTEAEVREVADFVNFVFKHARWDFESKEAFDFTKLYQKMAQHVKKCEDHIFEHKATYQSRDEGNKE